MSGTVNKVALTFLAHPDDAEILCAGTLIRLAQAGWEIHIATATAGDCGSSTLRAEEISRIRVVEAAAAAKMIGATYHCLHELDGLICMDKPTLRKAYDLFREVAPGLVFTHAAKDYMMDHEQVSILARSASFIYAAPNCSTLPVKTGSRVPYLYYCDPLEGIDPLGKPVEPTTLVDITDAMETKEKMLACHASQRQWLQDHHGMDEYIDAMKRHAAQRGKLIGKQYAEAFVQHRGHAYPQDDLLLELFC
ncbi:MAG TPA: PIG-L deacetylase family protein [Tepidisphaeraceae bacterium]|jgi:LmbE family N-acetylglucosaminyl deacetylase